MQIYKLFLIRTKKSFSSCRRTLFAVAIRQLPGEGRKRACREYVDGRLLS